MLLTIDVGNTNITMGVYDDDKVVGSFRMTTKTPRTSDELGILICNMMITKGINPDEIEYVIISSVVPKIMYSLTSSIKKYLNLDPIIINSDIKTGITIKCDNPKEVGADRIVNVAAAHHTYKKACLVIDFGTATTYDYVSDDGVFQYTIISPGIEISAQALVSQTAKLPDIEIKKPASILASNTINGMQAGLVYGYIGQVEYTIKQMKKELGQDMMVIATGGLGRIIVPETDLIDLYDPDLAYHGMKIIFDLNKEDFQK